MLVKYLVMIFKTESGEKVDLSISNIKEDLTADEISAAMDVIIAKDAFIAKGGSLKEKLSAQIITKNVDQIVVA